MSVVSGCRKLLNREVVGNKAIEIYEEVVGKVGGTTWMRYEIEVDGKITNKSNYLNIAYRYYKDRIKVEQEVLKEKQDNKEDFPWAMLYVIVALIIVSIFGVLGVGLIIALWIIKQ